MAISYDGSRVVIGERGGVNGGRVYVFIKNGTTWTKEAKLNASDAVNGDNFGGAVSITSSGDRIAVGATGKNATYIFSRTGGTWTQEAKLLNSDTGAGDYFASRTVISKDGSVILASSDYKTETYAQQGSVYVFLEVVLHGHKLQNL